MLTATWLFSAGLGGYDSIMQAEVIAIGDELTSGQRLDTNSQWISRELALLGIPVSFHTTVSDTLSAGIEAFRAAIDRADVVIATGGLGPTADDLTRDVLAKVADVPLQLIPDVVANIEARFASRGVSMPKSNTRQAMLPEGSVCIPNPTGTAPGIDMLGERSDGSLSHIFCLPGVPSEMHCMWRETVVTALLAMQPEEGTIRFRSLKCFGAGESAIESMLPDLIQRGREPVVGITAHEATITLRIAARGVNSQACESAIAPVEATIRKCLGMIVFGSEQEEVEDATVKALRDSGHTLAVVEGTTAGRVTSLCAQAMARQQCHGEGMERGGFRGGRVIVPDSGIGGGQSAVQLADQARSEWHASLGLGVGVERQAVDGRTAIDIAISSEQDSVSFEHVLGGGRELALSRASKTAVDSIRRYVLERMVEK
ncbi:MAG: molybdopterin-binding protein [Pirellulales bacterium]